MEIRQKEVPLFRGAVLKSMGDQADLLYHNHVGNDKLRYSYPLIQYKRIGGKAAIVCIEDGVDLIGQFLTRTEGSMTIGTREVTFSTSRIQPARLLIQTWENAFDYHVTRWLPLNAKNYQFYQATETVIERVMLLENILKANLLSMLKGLGIHLEQELLVKIAQLSDPYVLDNKGIGMTAFNVDFCSNLSIPNNVGIGKNASIGYGIVHFERKDKNNHNNNGASV